MLVALNLRQKSSIKIYIQNLLFIRASVFGMIFLLNTRTLQIVKCSKILLKNTSVHFNIILSDLIEVVYEQMLSPAMLGHCSVFRMHCYLIT